MTLRKFTEAETQTAQERVAKHRERLKSMGVKRLDLSITPKAFESLKTWASQNNLSYSEAAEHLFLAASAPLSDYISSDTSVYSAQGAVTEQSARPPMNVTQVMSDTSVVSAFFANRQTTVKPV